MPMSHKAIGEYDEVAGDEAGGVISSTAVCGVHSEATRLRVIYSASEAFTA